MKSNFSLALSIFVILIGVGVAILVGKGEFFKNLPNDYPVNVTIGAISVPVMVADTPDKQQKGLSVLNSLPEGNGMLFPFEQSGYHSFWMKDMHFSIDMIWISEQNVVVYVKENVSPDTYPTVFTPESEAKYVLEVNAGFFTRSGLKIGDPVTISGLK